MTLVIREKHKRQESAEGSLKGPGDCCGQLGPGRNRMTLEAEIRGTWFLGERTCHGAVALQRGQVGMQCHQRSRLVLQVALTFEA